MQAQRKATRSRPQTDLLRVTWVKRWERYDALLKQGSSSTHCAAHPLAAKCTKCSLAARTQYAREPRRLLLCIYSVEYALANPPTRQGASGCAKHANSEQPKA
jgi:hypothetical protein